MHNSPLEIMIAIHYHVYPGTYSKDDLNHARSSAVKEIKERFLKLGLLKEARKEFKEKYGADYEGTEGLKVWVNALCNIPKPIMLMTWIIPETGG